PERVCSFPIVDATGRCGPAPTVLGRGKAAASEMGIPMKRLASIGAAVVALVLVVAAVAAATRAPRLREAVTIHVVEHAVSDPEVDTDGSGGTSDTQGDLLTFHNPIYDASNTNVVGRDLGECVLIVPGRAYDCTFTAFL